MKPTTALPAITLIALVTLAGCGDKKTTQAEGANFAEVLPASASDAMPPYDTASSAPPLAAPSLATSSDSTAKPKTARPASTDEDIAPEAEPT